MRALSTFSLLIIGFLVPLMSIAQEEDKSPARKMHIKTITIVDGDTTISETELNTEDLDVDKSYIKVLRLQEDILQEQGIELKELEDMGYEMEALMEEAGMIKLSITLDDGKPCDHHAMHKVIIMDDDDHGNIRKIIIPDTEMKGDMIWIDSAEAGQHRMNIHEKINIDSILQANGIDPDSLEGMHKFVFYGDEAETEGITEPHKVIIKKHMDAPMQKDIKVRVIEKELMTDPLIDIDIDMEAAETFFRIMPDPIASGLRISAPGAGKFILTLEDEQGKTLQKQVSKVNRGQYQGYISLKDLEHGIYFVSLKHGEQNAKKKLMIH